MTMSSDSPAQVLVKLEQVSVYRKSSHSIYKFFKDLEESKHEESSGWKKKYQELEQEYNKMINTTKWLRERIKELEGSLSQQKLDTENAVSARDAALRKLKHARKVIRDLLIERSDMQSPRVGTIVSQAEIDAALHDGVVRKTSPPSTPTSSKSTVRRPSPAPTLPSTPLISNPHRSIRSIPFDPDRMVDNSSSPRGMPPNAPSGPSNSSMKQPPQAHSSSFQSSRPSPAYSTTSLSSEEELYIHYSIPSSHQIVKGPYSKEQLHQDLDLNISDVDALSRITASQGLGMKLHITQCAERDGGDMVAFLYSPVFLEGSRQGNIDCRAIEWGRSQDAERAHRYIQSKKQGERRLFHTFTFPTTDKGKRGTSGWYYLGAMEWEVVDVNIEPPEEEMSKIVRELFNRTKKLYSKGELRHMIETEDIKVFGAALKKIEDIEEASRFLRRHDGLNVVSPMILVNQRI